jgi:glycosyltransferase involved in cell wall biosynthesis
MHQPGPSRLEVAGFLKTEHHDYLAAIRRDMHDAGMEDQFHYHGSVDRAGKIAFLRSLDVLSVPSPYAEPKGLFVLEAMACGVPVVQPRHGAYPELIARAGGGITVEPNDPVSLAEGILTLWKDGELRQTLSSRAYDGVRRHYTARNMAERLVEVYTDVLAHPRNRSLVS